MHGLTEREEYLFDVQGWLVIPDVLELRLLRALNDALDANQGRFAEEDEDLVEESGTLAGEHRRRTCRGMLEWPHPHCDPFRRAALEPARFYDKAIIEPDGSVSRPWEEYDEPPLRTAG